MIYCERLTHTEPVLATRFMRLHGKHVDIVRPFCTPCAVELSGVNPVSGLEGVDVGAVEQPMDMGHLNCDICDDARAHG